MRAMLARSEAMHADFEVLAPMEWLRKWRPDLLGAVPGAGGVSGFPAGSGRDANLAATTARPGPHPLPTCDYCGDEFLDPRRGYKHGCPKHDPYFRQRRERELLASDYGVVRAVVRASRAENVEIALIALDRLHSLAMKEIR